MSKKTGLQQYLQQYLEKRDALFRNPTLEGALALMPPPPGGWEDKTVPLAALHKARLQWLDADNAMLSESVRWLEAHAYGSSWRGAPPLTPETRDQQRRALGQAPLGGEAEGKADGDV